MREHALKGIGLSAVHGKPILAADLYDASGEPALVLLGHPFGGIMSTLSFCSVSVDLWSRQREVQEVSGKAVLVAKFSSQRPLSCASDRATMCSMSVCLGLKKYRPVYGS